MSIFESLFDVLYLSVVVGLGMRLLLEKTRGARLFGLMAILLGLGDAFHLMPRVLSHLSPLGFAGHEAALSWGQFVTSITMTVFYLLYYHFYRNQSGDCSNTKRYAIYALAAIRILLAALPQNGWGQLPGNYLFGIFRNIPFAIMGALLIYWSFKERTKPGLEGMWWLILLSFLFYIPVVLWSERFPPIGALMMPKTVAYLAIVVRGFRYFVGAFKGRSILGIAYANLTMGLVAGVFYREFTKFYRFTEPTHLGKLHAHTLALGFIGMLLFYLLARDIEAHQLRKIKRPIYLFESGLVFTVVNMAVIGLYEVVGQGQETINPAAISGTSGLGHILLAAGLVWTLVLLYGAEKGRLEKAKTSQN